MRDSFSRPLIARHPLALGWVVAMLLLASCWTLPHALADQPTGDTRAPSDPSMPAITSEQAEQKRIDQIMEFLKSTQPDVYEKAVALRQSDPKRFETLIHNAAPQFRKLEQLQERDPEMFRATLKDLELTHRSLQIAAELHNPELTASDVEQRKQDLKGVVAEQFAVRQRLRQLELDELAKRLESLKSTLKDRDRNRNQLIEQRVKELVGQPPKLDW